MFFLYIQQFLKFATKSIFNSIYVNVIPELIKFLFLDINTKRKQDKMWTSFRKIKKNCLRSQPHATDILNSTMTSESACTAIDSDMCEHCQLQTFFYKFQNPIKCRCGVKKSDNESILLKKRKRSAKKRQRISGSFRSTVHRKYVPVRCHVQTLKFTASVYDVDGSIVNFCGFNGEANKFNQFGQLQVWYV